MAARFFDTLLFLPSRTIAGRDGQGQGQIANRGLAARLDGDPFGSVDTPITSLGRARLP